MYLILTEAAEATVGGGSGYMLFMLIAMFAIFYFFMIAPDRKKRKKTEEMRNSLSLGDEITTIGGMTGKILMVS